MGYDEIVEAIDEAFCDKTIDLKEKLADVEDIDLVDIYMELDDVKKEFFRKKMPIERIVSIFLTAYYDETDFISVLSFEEIAYITDNMPFYDARNILNNLENEERKYIINLLSIDKRDKFFLVDSFNENEVGKYLVFDYLKMPYDISLFDAIRKIESYEPTENNVIFLNNDKYYGTLFVNDVKNLYEKNHSDCVNHIDTTSPYLLAHDLLVNKQDIIRNTYDNIPVLDEDLNIMGVILSSDFDEFDFELKSNESTENTSYLVKEFMSTNYLSIDERTTVNDAFLKIKNMNYELNTIIVTSYSKFLGYITVETLNDNNKRLYFTDLIDKEAPVFKENDSFSRKRPILESCKYDAVCVTDEDGYVLGIVEKKIVKKEEEIVYSNDPKKIKLSEKQLCFIITTFILIVIVDIILLVYIIDRLIN